MKRSDFFKTTLGGIIAFLFFKKDNEEPGINGEPFVMTLNKDSQDRYIHCIYNGELPVDVEPWGIIHIKRKTDKQSFPFTNSSDHKVTLTSINTHVSYNVHCPTVTIKS